MSVFVSLVHVQGRSLFFPFRLACRVFALYFCVSAPHLHTNTNLESVNIPLRSVEIIKPISKCGRLAVARFGRVL